MYVQGNGFFVLRRLLCVGSVGFYSVLGVFEVRGGLLMVLAV